MEWGSSIPLLFQLSSFHFQFFEARRILKNKHWQIGNALMLGSRVRHTLVSHSKFVFLLLDLITWGQTTQNVPKYCVWFSNGKQTKYSGRTVRLTPRLHDATFGEHWWIFVEICWPTKIEPCGRPFNMVYNIVHQCCRMFKHAPISMDVHEHQCCSTKFASCRRGFTVSLLSDSVQSIHSLQTIRKRRKTSVVKRLLMRWIRSARAAAQPPSFLQSNRHRPTTSTVS